MRTITISEAARIKGVGRPAIRAAIKAGKLRTVKVEISQTHIIEDSLAGFQPNPNMKRAGRKPKRVLCPGCDGQLTSADRELGACTQCGRKL